MGEKGRRFTYIPEVKRDGLHFRFRCRCGETAKYGNVFLAAKYALQHMQVCRP